MAILFYSIIFVTTVLAVSKIPLQVPRVECQESTNRFHPYPKICNVYYECNEGQMHIKMCKLGMNFNSELGICDHIEPKDCVVAQENKIENKFCSQMFIGQVPDPDNCKQFIICFLGVHHYKKCELGFVYNQRTGYCDHPSNVAECSEDMKRYITTNETSNYSFTPYRMDDSYNDDENETSDSLNQVIGLNSSPTANYIVSFQNKSNEKNDMVQQEISAISQKPQSTSLETVSSSSKPYNQYTESLHNYWTRHWSFLVSK